MTGKSAIILQDFQVFQMLWQPAVTLVSKHCLEIVRPYKLLDLITCNAKIVTVTGHTWYLPYSVNLAAAHRNNFP